MRVVASRKVKVGPGDEIVIQARLNEKLRLARLYVFARERRNSNFSPYVSNLNAVNYTEPHMYTPMSMRLTEAKPEQALKFTADIDGFIQVMQEIDIRSDPRIKVKVRRRVCQDLGWKEWITRILPW